MSNAELTETLLVVEDEFFIRMSAIATLQDAGYSVLEAANSAEALDVMARHDDISILLTDVTMPGRMDGLALVARTQRDHPAIRAIVVSANVSADQASHAGAMGFVAKPYLPQDIVQAVRDTIRRH